MITEEKGCKKTTIVLKLTNVKCTHKIDYETIGDRRQISLLTSSEFRRIHSSENLRFSNDFTGLQGK